MTAATSPSSFAEIELHAKMKKPAVLAAGWLISDGSVFQDTARRDAL